MVPRFGSLSPIIKRAGEIPERAAEWPIAVSARERLLPIRKRPDVGQVARRARPLVYPIRQTKPAAFRSHYARPIDSTGGASESNPAGDSLLFLQGRRCAQRKLAPLADVVYKKVELRDGCLTFHYPSSLQLSLLFFFIFASLSLCVCVSRFWPPARNCSFTRICGRVSETQVAAELEILHTREERPPPRRLNSLSRRQYETGRSAPGASRSVERVFHFSPALSAPGDF